MTYQVLIALTLLAYFNVLADWFTQKMRRLVAVAQTEDGLAQMRERVRGGNSSVSPVEEINMNNTGTGNTGNTMAADNDQNINGLKDHIR